MNGWYVYRFLPKSLFSCVYFRGHSSEQTLGLTFDDGPHLKYTPLLLELLAAHRVPATFFVTGEKVVQAPEIVRKIKAGDHTLANHGLVHQSLMRLSYQQILYSIMQTNAIIEDIVHEPIIFFRPPYGRVNWNVYRVCRNLQMKIVLWDVIPHDYHRQITAEQLKDRILEQIRPNSIILLHDGLDTSEKLVAALPKTIESAKARGFVFKSMADMIKN